MTGSLVFKLKPSDVGMHLTSFALANIHNELFPYEQLTPVQVADDKLATIEKIRRMLHLRSTT